MKVGLRSSDLIEEAALARLFGGGRGVRLQHFFLAPSVGDRLGLSEDRVLAHDGRVVGHVSRPSGCAG